MAGSPHDKAGTRLGNGMIGGWLAAPGQAGAWQRVGSAAGRQAPAYLRSLGTPVLGSVINDVVHEVPLLVQKLL